MGRPAALLFPTGFTANIGIIDGLMRSSDTILADQLAHASIVDGVRLTGIRPRFFRHNDAADLERKLARSKGRKLVAVEGVYSMEGDIGAPIANPSRKRPFARPPADSMPGPVGGAIRI